MRSFIGRISFLLVVAIAVGIGAHSLRARAASPSVKATWFWDTPQIQTDAEGILDFMVASGVNAVYLQINRDVKPDAYKRFIRAAGEKGIEVQALDGRASWGLESGRPGIDAFLNWVEAYQAKAAEEEKFSGIHVDIEPYASSFWNIEDAAHVAQWQQNVSHIVRRASDMGLKVEADLPFWLGNYSSADGTEPLGRWMIRQFDAVTILAYRNTAQAIVNAAIPGLTEAAGLGVPATIAVETKASSEGVNISFYTKGLAAMDEQLAQAGSLLAEYGSFKGLAVHDYRGWKALKS